jgi:hypothetical protein
MHCHMGELVTRRLTEMCFHWENKAVSPNSYSQWAVELNRNQEWGYMKRKVKRSDAETTKRTSQKINTKEVKA